jgi:hypothetical protein
LHEALTDDAGRAQYAYGKFGCHEDA